MRKLWYSRTERERLTQEAKSLLGPLPPLAPPPHVLYRTIEASHTRLKSVPPIFSSPRLPLVGFIRWRPATLALGVCAALIWLVLHRSPEIPSISSRVSVPPIPPISDVPAFATPRVERQLDFIHFRTAHLDHQLAWEQLSAMDQKILRARADLLLITATLPLDTIPPRGERRM